MRDWPFMHLVTKKIVERRIWDFNEIKHEYNSNISHEKYHFFTFRKRTWHFPSHNSTTSVSCSAFSTFLLIILYHSSNKMFGFFVCDYSCLLSARRTQVVFILLMLESYLMLGHFLGLFASLGYHRPSIVCTWC